MCVVHMSGDSAAEHLIHSSVVQQRDAAQDDSISVQAAEEKTEQ